MLPRRERTSPVHPAGAPRLPAGPPTDVETYGLALAALGTAVMTLIVDSSAPLTVGLLVLALVPWALIAADVRVPLPGFVAAAIIPAAAVVVTADAGAPIFFGMFAVIRVASVTGRRLPVLVTMAAATSLPILFDLNKPAGPTDAGLPYFMIGIAAGALWGFLFHHQRRLAAELQWSQDRLREAASAEERRRIARDVHDVLAHSLTAVVVNVAGARRTLDSRPDLTGEALRQAEQIARDSVDDVRRIVGLLRPGEGRSGGGVPPVPSAADVPSIVAARREAGMAVTLRVAGDLSAVGPMAGSALARIVQEALTNAERHAPGAAVDVGVEVDDETLALNVRNGPAQHRPLDPDGPRQGLGVLGMRERIEALDGTFTAGPTADGGWEVDCAVPRTSRRHAEGALRA